MKLLIITWVHICISFNKLLWFMQKNDKIDILSLVFMPFTGNKSPGAKKGSDEWQCDNFTNIFWVKRTFTPYLFFFCNFMESSFHILSCPWFSPRMTGLRSSVLSFPAFLWLRRSGSKLLSVICSDVMTRTTLLFVHCLTTLKSL